MALRVKRMTCLSPLRLFQTHSSLHPLEERDE
jgi:hypothetical protein